jgi:hypothetical protein
VFARVRAWAQFGESLGQNLEVVMLPVAQRYRPGPTGCIGRQEVHVVDLGGKAPSCPALRSEEGQEIGIDRVCVCGRHAVGKALIGLERPVSQKLCRKRRRVRIRHDLIVVAV